jgi:hypothetical protein
MSSPIIKKKNVPNPDKSRAGFALVTAILAIMILMALGYLALTVSTGDLRISGRMVGEKKALSAAETGVHRLAKGFDIGDLTAIWVEGVRQPLGVERQSDSATDPASRYTISNPLVALASPPRPLPGFSTDWGQKPYRGRVSGKNTAYDSNSDVEVDVGMGFGPVVAGTTTYK